MIVKKVASIPTARTSAAAILHGRYIYMLGGNLAQSKSTTKCCRLDIYKRKWEVLPDLNESRANSGCVVIDKYLYVFGGFQSQPAGQVTINSIERLDISGNLQSWEVWSLKSSPSQLNKQASFYMMDLTSYLS